MTTTFFTAVVVMIAVAAICGLATSRLGVTQTVGEILAGVLLGPTVLGHLWPRLEHDLFPKSVTTPLEMFSLVIVLTYVAQTGAAIDGRVFTMKRGRVARIVGAATVFALVGAVAIRDATPELAPHHYSDFAFVLFVSAVLLVTAIPVLARILDETGLLRTYVGAWALVLSVWTDLVAFTAAAIGTASAAGTTFSSEVWAGPTLLVILALACKSLAPRVGRIGRRDLRMTVDVTVLMLALAGASASGASTLGVAFIVGALLWRRGERNGAAGATSFVRALVPVYLVYTGLTVDMTIVTRPHLIAVTVFVILVALGAKVLASLLAARMLELGRRETRILAVLGNSRGVTELILIGLGHASGILSEETYTVFFVMTIVMTAASGALAQRLARSVIGEVSSPFAASVPLAPVEPAG